MTSYSLGSYVIIWNIFKSEINICDALQQGVQQEVHFSARGGLPLVSDLQT